MKHPDFKHRAMPSGGNYEEFDKLDLLAFVNDSIDYIQSTIDLMAEQYRPNEDVPMFSDEVNLKILNQITLSVLDIRTMFDWYINSHELVRTDNDRNEPHYLDGSVDSEDNITIN